MTTVKNTFIEIDEAGADANAHLRQSRYRTMPILQQEESEVDSDQSSLPDAEANCDVVAVSSKLVQMPGPTLLGSNSRVPVKNTFVEFEDTQDDEAARRARTCPALDKDLVPSDIDLASVHSNEDNEVDSLASAEEDAPRYLDFCRKQDISSKCRIKDVETPEPLHRVTAQQSPLEADEFRRTTGVSFIDGASSLELCGGIFSWAVQSGTSSWGFRRRDTETLRDDFVLKESSSEFGPDGASSYELPRRNTEALRENLVASGDMPATQPAILQPAELLVMPQQPVKQSIGERPAQAANRKRRPKHVVPVPSPWLEGPSSGWPCTPAMLPGLNPFLPPWMYPPLTDPSMAVQHGAMLQNFAFAAKTFSDPACSTAAAAGPKLAASEMGQRQGKNRPPRVWCHIYLHMLVNGFDLVPMLIGRGGQNMRKIFNDTGAKIRVRGKGSGHLEIDGEREAPTPLMVAVTSDKTDHEGFKKAIAMVFVQLRSVEKRFLAWCQRTGHVHEGPCFSIGCMPPGGDKLLGEIIQDVPFTATATEAS
jgi:hypothetical protein